MEKHTVEGNAAPSDLATHPPQQERAAVPAWPAKRGILDIESGRACEVNQHDHRPAPGFRNVWLVPVEDYAAPAAPATPDPKEAILAILHPLLDLGDSRFPDAWAVKVASIVTGGDGCATPESAEPVAWRVDWVASATNEPKCCYRTNQDAAELVIEELSEAVPPMPATLTALFDRPAPAASTTAQSEGGLREALTRLVSEFRSEAATNGAKRSGHKHGVGYGFARAADRLVRVLGDVRYAPPAPAAAGRDDLWAMEVAFMSCKGDFLACLEAAMVALHKRWKP